MGARYFQVWSADLGRWLLIDLKHGVLSNGGPEPAPDVMMLPQLHPEEAKSSGNHAGIREGERFTPTISAEEPHAPRRAHRKAKP